MCFHICKTHFVLLHGNLSVCVCICFAYIYMCVCVCQLTHLNAICYSALRVVQENLSHRHSESLISFGPINHTSLYMFLLGYPSRLLEEMKYSNCPVLSSPAILWLYCSPFPIFSPSTGRTVNQASPLFYFIPNPTQNICSLMAGFWWKIENN